MMKARRAVDTVRWLLALLLLPVCYSKCTSTVNEDQDGKSKIAAWKHERINIRERSEASNSPTLRRVGQGSYDILENGAGQFKVDISGCPGAGAAIESVSIEDVTIDPVSVGVDTSGRKLYCPGPPQFGSIVLRVRKPSCGSLMGDWWQDASENANKARSVDISSFSLEGNKRVEVRRWEFQVVPVTYDPGDVHSPRADYPTETMTCEVKAMRMLSKPTRDGSSDPGERLNGAFTSIVREDGGSEDGVWEGIVGGEENIREEEAAREGCPRRPARSVSVAQLELSGPVTDGREELCQWVSAAAEVEDSGTDDLDLEIQQLEADIGELRRRRRLQRERAHKRSVRVTRTADGATTEFEDCVLTRYSFPKFSQAGVDDLTEGITLRPNGVVHESDGCLLAADAPCQPLRWRRETDEMELRCTMFCLPSALIGRIWPAERMVAGLRVCRQVRAELSQQAESILLVKPCKAEACEDALVKDFVRVSHLKVTLKWQGQLRGLKCAANIGLGLIHLDLSECSPGLGSEQVEMLVEVLGECQALTHLDLRSSRDGGLGAEAAERLAAVLEKLVALAHLDLGGNCLGDGGARRVAEALEECTALSYLGLAQNEIELEGAGRLAGTLGRCPTLTHLDLRRNWLCGDGASRLAAGLGECALLRFLDLAGNGIDVAGAVRLAEAVSGCRALAHLDLAGNALGVEGAGVFADVLGDCEAMARLDLSGNYLRAGGAWRLAEGLENCASLSHLRLAQNEIGDEGVKGLAPLLERCRALALLDLRSNRIGAEGVGRLAQVLCQCEALTHLNVRANDIGADGAGVLAEALGGCKALVHLDLSFSEVGDQGAGKLAAVLGECTRLAHLNLNLNGITADGAARLCRVLGACNALAHLDLSGNAIGAEGAGSLAAVLGECRHLTHLNLKSTEMGADGARRLARALGECGALSHLDLRQNHIGAQEEARLALQLGASTKLTHCDLRFNASPKRDAAGGIAQTTSWRLVLDAVMGLVGALVLAEVAGEYGANFLSALTNTA